MQSVKYDLINSTKPSYKQNRETLSWVIAPFVCNKSGENSDSPFLRFESSPLALSWLMKVKNKWRIMRTRRECADHVGDWKGGGWSAKDRGDYSDGRRNLRRRDERRETAKLNGCDPSRMWARLLRTREHVENFPDVCMNKFFSPPSARSKLLAAGRMARCTAIIDLLKFISCPFSFAITPRQRTPGLAKYRRYFSE